MREGKATYEQSAYRASPPPVETETNEDAPRQPSIPSPEASLKLIASTSSQFRYSTETILTSVLLGISKESAEDALRTIRRKDERR